MIKEKARAVIDNVEIGREPKIVAVIGGPKVLSLANEAEREEADILEIRTDLFNNGYNVSKIVKTFQQVKKETSLPLLITIRRLEEGGLYYRFQKSEEKRFRIFRSVMGLVDAVDIELTAKIRDRVIEEARKRDVTPIVSYHDFYKTPSLAKLREFADQAHELDSKIIKIATMANSKEDVIELFRFLLEAYEKYDKPITAISMSNIGSVSRIAFPFYGSCLTYGHVSKDKANAPGQLTVKMLRDFLDEHKDKILKIRIKLPMVQNALEINIFPVSERRLVAMI